MTINLPYIIGGHMKILAIADTESKYLWDYYSPEKLEGVELIISCGDLRAEYLEFLVTMCKCPVAYVPGNHDAKYVNRPPEGCICLDGSVYEYNGFRIFGISGSMRYKQGPFMYTEDEMRKRIRNFGPEIIKSSGIDIFVTHSPAKGHGDMEDLPHRGFECFNKFLNICHPWYMFHDHVHSNYSSKFVRTSQHECDTEIINACERIIVDADKTTPPIPKKELIKNLIFRF